LKIKTDIANVNGLKTQTFINMYEVREKDNPNALHASGFYTKEKAQAWIERYGDSGMFTDKDLSKSSFEVVKKK